MVHCKAGVRFAQITPDLVAMLRALVRVADHPTVPTDGLVITSGSDGQHAAQSKHYTGQAVDVRSKTFAGPDKPSFQAVLQQELGARFTVLLEHEGRPNEHWHIQVRKGLS